MNRFAVMAAFAALALLAPGCPPPAADRPGDGTTTPATSEEHRHGSGPHGGAVADWGGGEYHVEFTVDHDTKESAVYILGGDAKTPAPVKAPSLTLAIDDPVFEVELAAQPLEGEAEGTSSRFVGRHENLGIVREFSGTITGVVDGVPYAGQFKEEP
jgi:hypothetical protein